MFCSHWQSSHHTFEETVPDRVFNCSLLSSCHRQDVGNTTYPTIIKSGERNCLPNPFKRRACTPGCPTTRKYCHGRCVFGSRCLFSPCSRTPYRENAGSLCSNLAIDATDGSCKDNCENILSDDGLSCQTCLDQELSDDQSCQQLSGAPCWHCGKSIYESWNTTCKDAGNEDEIIQCVKDDLQSKSLSSCEKCICTLFCYWFPAGGSENLCRSCLDKTDHPEHAPLFLHHDSCPQGWVYSKAEESGTEPAKCFKSFNKKKPWTYAKTFCERGGGVLAQPKTDSSIHRILEAINLLNVTGMYWVGGKHNGNNWVWVDDDSSNVDSSHWAPGYHPTLGLLVL